MTLSLVLFASLILDGNFDSPATPYGPPATALEHLLRSSARLRPASRAFASRWIGTDLVMA